MSRRRHCATTLAVLGMLVAACSSGDDDAVAIVGTTTPTTPVTETTNAVTETIAPVSEETDAEPAPLPDPDEQHWLRTRWEHTVGNGPGRIEADVGFAPALLPPGNYTTDAMYTPVAFTLTEHTRLLSERPTFMVLVDHGASGLWSVPIVHLIRPHRLTDPATTSDGPPRWPPTIDGWDFDAWFDAHPGLRVERSDIEIDGIAARRYDVTFPSDGDVGWQAEPNLRVVPLLRQYGGVFDLVSSDLARIWTIPQGDDAPIVIHAAVDVDDGWGEWGDRLDALVDSLELGEPAPVGIVENVWEAGLSTDVPAGVVELPILGGVRFELPGEFFVEQSRNWSYINIPGDWNFFAPNVEVAAAPQAFDFTPVTTAEQLAELLVAEVGATRLPDRELLGQPAVVVEMLGVQPGIPVFRHVALPEDAHPDVAVWYTQDYVELWAVDTDAGVLIVTAEAANPDELAVALELHEQVRTTLELL